MLSVRYFISRVRAFLLGAREVVAILASRRASDFFYAALFRAFFYAALFSRGRLCSFVWFFQVFVPPCTPSPLRAHLDGRHRSDLLAGERLTFFMLHFFAHLAGFSGLCPFCTSSRGLLFYCGLGTL